MIDIDEQELRSFAGLGSVDPDAFPKRFLVLKMIHERDAWRSLAQALHNHLHHTVCSIKECEVCAQQVEAEILLNELGEQFPVRAV
jgi:hypothetical protein